MNRKEFVGQLLLLGMGVIVAGASAWTPRNVNEIRLLRHATLVIQLGKRKFLIDPMLSAKDAMDPIQNAGNDTRIPMTHLPINEKELKQLLDDIDAVIITHTHRDHWDVAAQTLIGKHKPVFCQPADLEKLKSQGFTKVIAVSDQVTWKGITLSRTNGRHGLGAIEQKMGTVSGFVLKHHSDSIYIAGDTVWCADVREALFKHQPTVTVVNAGAPEYITGGGPITMTPEDVMTVHREFPSTRVVAVHMDTINHCRVSRSDLLATLKQQGMEGVIAIPADGERIAL